MDLFMLRRCWQAITRSLPTPCLGQGQRPSPATLGFDKTAPESGNSAEEGPQVDKTWGLFLLAGGGGTWLTRVDYWRIINA